MQRPSDLGRDCAAAAATSIMLTLTGSLRSNRSLLDAKDFYGQSPLPLVAEMS